MLNKVQLIGRLGQDPEVRTLNTGVKFSTFSLATSESYKDKSGQKVEKTEWHNIVVWKQLADIVERYLNKGDLVYVEGKIETKKFTDKEGNDRYMTQINGFNLTMLGSKSKPEVAGASTSKPQTPPASQSPVQAPAQDEEDDLPF